MTDRFEGDLALSALISLHGLTMNGGVFHPFDVLSQSEMKDALRAYRYYGLDAVADLFIRAKALLENGWELDTFEKIVDEEYFAQIPDDQTLVQVFERHLAEFPALYAPL